MGCIAVISSLGSFLTNTLLSLQLNGTMNAALASMGGFGSAGGQAFGIGGGVTSINLDETSVRQALKDYFERKSGFAALNAVRASNEDYLKDFPLVLDSFLAVDFRSVLNKKTDNETQRGYVTAATHFFTKLNQIANENAEGIKPHIEKMGKLLEWWGRQLKTTELPLDGIQKATQTVLSSLQLILMNDSSIGAAVLPGALSCLALEDKSLVSIASGVVSQVARSNKQAFVDNIDAVLMALEYGLPGDAAMSLLTALEGAYSRAPEAIHAHIDTIAEYAVTKQQFAGIGGCMVLKKVAKRCPRLLYAFVDDFIPLLENQTTGMFVLQMFVDIAARNALILSPHLKAVSFATEEHGFIVGAKAIGYIGRTTREKADEALEILVRWVLDDVDPESIPKMVEQIRNIGGVYKAALDPYVEKLRGLTSSGNSELQAEVTKLMEYYDGSEKFSSDAFLTNQEDIYGRILAAVNEAVEAKTSDLNQNIEEIMNRVDHQEERAKDLEEKHYVLADTVSSNEERLNVVELASKEQEKRLDEVEASVEDVQKELKEKDEEIKKFIAEVSKKLPVPTGVEAKGKIRKRILLRFECARGTKPDFIMETASWTKWLRVAASAVSTGKNIAIGNVGGTIQGLMDMFKNLRRKDADPQLKFDTLVKQPFLTSTEQDELINGLRAQGFFDEFEYNASSATWERKMLEPGTFSVETGCAFKPAEGQKDDSGSSKGKGKGPAKSSEKEGDESPPGKMPELTDDAPKGATKSEDVLLRGWFEKKGAINPAPKTRYFEVDKSTLKYYENESRSKLKGSINLDAVVSFVEQPNGWLKLITPGVHGGNYRLKVSTIFVAKLLSTWSLYGDGACHADRGL